MNLYVKCFFLSMLVLIWSIPSLVFAQATDTSTNTATNTATNTNTDTTTNTPTNTATNTATSIVTSAYCCTGVMSIGGSSAPASLNDPAGLAVDEQSLNLFLFMLLRAKRTFIFISCVYYRDEMK